MWHVPTPGAQGPAERVSSEPFGELRRPTSGRHFRVGRWTALQPPINGRWQSHGVFGVCYTVILFFFLRINSVAILRAPVIVKAGCSIGGARSACAARSLLFAVHSFTYEILEVQFDCALIVVRCGAHLWISWSLFRGRRKGHLVFRWCKVDFSWFEGHKHTKNKDTLFSEASCSSSTESSTNLEGKLAPESFDTLISDLAPSHVHRPFCKKS